MRLFHASRSVDIIARFNPFSHFGTQCAAMARSGSRHFNDQTSTFYEVEFNALKPLRIHDIQHADKTSEHSVCRFVDWLFYEEKKISSTDRDAVFCAAAPGGTNSSAGFLALANILKSKGYDSIVYTNQFEDIGSESWMNLDADQVNVVQVFREEAVQPKPGDSPSFDM